MPKGWFAIFKVKVTARVHMIMTVSAIIFCTADPFVIKLGLMVHYYKPECLMKELDCCVQGQGHGKNCKMSVTVYPDAVF